MAYASSYIKNTGVDNRLRKLGTDARDFAPMIAIWGIKGNTPAEREKDIETKIHTLEAAFTNSDHTARKPYLDMIFDLSDTFDPATADMNNEADVRRLLQCMMMNQTYAEKRKENLDYFNARYSTPQKNRLADTQNAYIGMVIGYVKANLEKTVVGVDEQGKEKTLEIKPGVSIFSSVSHTDRSVYDCATAFTKMQRDKARMELETGTAPSNVYELPVIDLMMRYAGKDVKEVLNIQKPHSNVLESYSSFLIDSMLCERQNKNMEGLMEADLSQDMPAVYVDGMPFAEFRKQNFPDKNSSNTLNLNILTNLMLNDRHRVDIVHSYRNEAGEMQYEAKTLKAVVTPEQEKLYLKQFSWIRRTFFNWGRFRIEPLKEKLARIETDPEKDASIKERYEKICADLKQKVEEGIEKKAEKARKDALEKAERQKWNDALKKETQLINNAAENSVNQYGKNSVIAILGQQVKTSYNDINAKLNTDPRYDAVAEIYAKQVLFTQLCTERISNNGEMGPLEQSLMGDTPETIKEKIEATARNMAKDPILKESFFKILGAANKDNMTLTRDGMKQAILNGGSKALTQVYIAQKGETHSKQQPTAAQPSMTLQQDAAAKAPVNLPG